MRQFCEKYKKRLIFCIFSIVFYYIIDLSMLTLQVHLLEFGVILLLLSYLFLFLSICFLISITTLRNPSIVFGIIIFILINISYNTFSDYLKTSLYYYSNKDDLQLLTKFVSEIERDDEALRDQSLEPFFTIYYWDIFFSEHKSTLGNLMDKLHIFFIKKHPDYYEYEISGYSFNRLKTISLVKYNSFDAIIRNEKNSAVKKTSSINENWYYKRCHYNSLNDRHDYWRGIVTDSKHASVTHQFE